MTSLINAEIFFFISTIGFSLVTILLCIALIYFIRILRRIDHISKKIETGVGSVTEEVKSLLTTIKESRIFSWLFKPNKRKGA